MNNDNGKIKINYVDLIQQQIFLAKVVWKNGIIKEIVHLGNADTAYHYLIPGFIDAHVHIESSMLTPVEFSRIATRHGTVAYVSDPHEIANVMGLEGVHFMLENAALTPFKIFFGAPLVYLPHPLRLQVQHLMLHNWKHCLKRMMLAIYLR